MSERFTELDVIELGPWCDYIPDGPSSLEHRIAKANGLTYGCPPRHWKWKAPVTERMRVPKEEK